MTQLVNATQLSSSPPEWLADQRIPRVGVGIVHGPSTAGKSLVIDGELTLAVANGSDWFGAKCVKGPVVLCLGEGVYDAGCRMRARLAREERDRTIAIAAECVAHGDEAGRALAASLPAYDEQNVSIITEPFSVALGRGGDMSPGMRQAIATIRSQVEAPELVVFDALADMTGGLSLSNDSSANRVMCGLKALSRELDCCILAVAHDITSPAPGRSTRLLGAGRLFNAADFCIAIAPDEVSAPGAARTATISCEKNKYGSPWEPMGYAIQECAWDQAAEDDAGNEIPGETVRVTSATVRLLETASSRTPEPQPAPPLPVIRDVERPRKRSGIRPRLHAVPDPAPRRNLTAQLLGTRCPECGRPNQVSCDTRMRGTSALIPVSLTPVVAVHADRAGAAWEAGYITEAELDAVLAAA